MSMLRERQIEACQERISLCAQGGLFDGAAEAELPRLWARSYYALERGPMAQWRSARAAREELCARAAREADFLSMDEYALVERMLIGHGETVLCDREEIAAAESLLSRLWCTLSVREETPVLCLPGDLAGVLGGALQTSEHREIRQRLFSYHATIHALLYLSGFLHAAMPVKHFLEQVAAPVQAGDEALALRFLRASFDYTVDARGDMLLVHPGLADPEHLVGALQRMGAPALELTESMMMGGMNGILNEEVPAADAMLGTITDALRPEYDPDEAVEDLRMLAKQGVPLPEVEEVLGSMLCVLPTQAMRAALRDMYLQTVRWAGIPSAALH